jgi:hypothetical protein
MSSFWKRDSALPPLPQEAFLPKPEAHTMADDIEAMKYAPPAVRESFQPVPPDEVEQTINRSVELLKALRRDLDTAHTEIHALHIENGVLERRCGDLGAELARACNELDAALEEKADALRGHDYMNNKLRVIAQQLLDVDFNPPPTPRKRAKKNGEPKAEPPKFEEPVPVPAPTETEPVQS